MADKKFNFDDLIQELENMKDEIERAKDTIRRNETTLQNLIDAYNEKRADLKQKVDAFNQMF